MLGLGDPGLDAAERLGVADALRAARHVPRRLAYVDGDGRERFALGGPALDLLVGERRFNLLRGDIAGVRGGREGGWGRSSGSPRRCGASRPGRSTVGGVRPAPGRAGPQARRRRLPAGRPAPSAGWHGARREDDVARFPRKGSTPLAPLRGPLLRARHGG
jgi:hypothetical protein